MKDGWISNSAGQLLQKQMVPDVVEVGLRSTSITRVSPCTAHGQRDRGLDALCVWAGKQMNLSESLLQVEVFAWSEFD
jgi:hypothetical protein